MKIKNSEFTISAVKESQYPKDGLPQIVLVGKSNVGKSSFINTLLNRKNLARTSSAPGKTRLINFYKIYGATELNKKLEDIKIEKTVENNIESNIKNNFKNDKTNIDLSSNNKLQEANDTRNLQDTNFYFVDLPGYGYSKMSQKEQIEVGRFIEDYFKKKNKEITLVIFLVDIRHNPTEDDKLMYNYIIKQNIPCIVITNKADKIAKTKVDDEVQKIQQYFNPLHDLHFFPFSSERKIYTEPVWEEIEKYL